MKHVVFSVFADDSNAHRTIDKVLSDPRVDRAQCNAVVHQGGIDVESTADHYGLEVEESDVGPSLVRHGFLGAVVGALIGAFAAWMQWLPFGAAVTAAVGGIAGACIGGLGAAITGVGLPHRRLKEFAKDHRDGRTVVTFEANSREMAERVEEVLRDVGVPSDRKRVV